jgi:hypothetical protein
VCEPQFPAVAVRYLRQIGNSVKMIDYIYRAYCFFGNEPWRSA